MTPAVRGNSHAQPFFLQELQLLLEFYLITLYIIVEYYCNNQQERRK